MASKRKTFRFSDEANNPGILHGNSYLISKITNHGKLQDYIEFAQKFPNGQLGEEFTDWLSQLQPHQVDELVDRFQTLNHPSQLDSSLYSDKTTIWSSLFNISTRGSGKGEILLIWLIRGSSMNGGTDAYDLDIQGKKYEVKDLSIQGNCSILAGVKSKVTNFHFWDELVNTIRKLKKIPLASIRELSPQAAHHAQQILNRQSTLLSGECNLTDLAHFNMLYRELNSIESPIQGYTTLILRGPNMQPIEIPIRTFTPPSSGPFHIDPLDHPTQTSTLTELRRLQYVRNPELVHIHMKQAVDQITEGITYIVFRKGRIHIATGFHPTTITMSSLKFIETSYVATK